MNADNNTFKYTDLNPHFTDQIRRLAKKHALAVEQLSESQLVEIIKQQIASGDIMKHIHYGWNDQGSGHKQSMIYIPYQGVEKLKAENAELKRKLEAVREAVK